MKEEIKILTREKLADEVAVVVGTRPGIVMFAPIIRQLMELGVPHFVIHSGQHYSPNMDADFFRDLELPPPDYRLDRVCEKKTHGGQTAAMLEGMENVLLRRRPRLVLVGGDANTNLAGALAARKLRMAVGHVESGERSYDWRMPEEHNRVIIDHISDLLFVTGDKALPVLEREGVRGKALVVGNPIVDASLEHLDLARSKSTLARELGLEKGGYFLMTTHREENVDVETNLRGALEGVSRAAVKLGRPCLFPVHPRTAKRLREFGLEKWAGSLDGIRMHEPLGYLDFLALVAGAGLVFTDSGGVQQEACIHNVPCVTLRENTEWTETVDIGANRLAGCDSECILAAAGQALAAPDGWTAPFGDGTASRRIARAAADVLAGRLEVLS